MNTMWLAYRFTEKYEVIMECVFLWIIQINVSLPHFSSSWNSTWAIIMMPFLLAFHSYSPPLLVTLPPEHPLKYRSAVFSKSTRHDTRDQVPSLAVLTMTALAGGTGPGAKWAANPHTLISNWMCKLTLLLTQWEPLTNFCLCLDLIQLSSWFLSFPRGKIFSFSKIKTYFYFIYIFYK